MLFSNQIPKDSPKLGPYTSQGPRLVVVFGSTESHSMSAVEDTSQTIGFRAKVEFKTGKHNSINMLIVNNIISNASDFGVPGVPMGDSNKCMV